MKKQLIKILAFILLFSSVLTIGNGIAIAEETGTWSIQQQVDEFGDVIPNSKPVIITPFSGTFDNTATKNEKLTGYAYFQIMSDNTHYALGFQLLEYGNIDATFLDSDKKTLKVKIQDKISEFNLDGVSPNGNVFTGVRDYEYGGDWLLNQLYQGQDLRCIVYLGSSKYSFNIQSGNLPQVLDQAGIQPSPSGITLKEALSTYLTDSDWTNNTDGFKTAYAYFYNHREDFDILTTSDLEKELQGNFLEIEVGQSDSRYWVIRNYDGSLSQQLYYWANHKERLNPEDIQYNRSEAAKEYSVADNIMTRNISGLNMRYQIRKIADGIYIRYGTNSFKKDAEYTNPDYIMISFDGSYAYGYDSEFKKMIGDIVPEALSKVK